MARLRTSRLASLGVLLFACLMAPAFAQERLTREVMFDIAAQSVEAALIEFSKQADVQVMVGGKLNGQKTEGVKGKLSVTEALTQLLKNTGLEYQTEGNSTVTVRSAAAAKTGARVRPLADRTRLAIRDPAAEAASPDRTNVDDPARPAVETLAEVVVTGTHIRGADTAGPVISFTSEEIAATGYATAQDWLETLPQNFASMPNEENGGLGNFNRGTTVNLRGLGTGTTLVLINGRRQPQSGVEGDFVDVSMIPASAIERVEVLTDGASAIYGSDAIGGVVNFILRTDLDGGETTLRFASANRDSDEVLFAQLWGGAWESGNVLFDYQYYERSQLMYADRDFMATPDKRPFGGDDFRSINSNPGNIYNPLTFVPQYPIPAGQDGTSLEASDLVVGPLNLQNSFEGAALLPRRKMHSAFLSLTQRVGSALELFLEGRYSQRESSLLNTAPNTVVTVPASNPFFVSPAPAPFGVTVGYSFLDDLGNPASHGETQGYAGTIGGTAALGRDWSSTLAIGAGREKLDYSAPILNQAAIRAALADPNPATALNVFGEGSNTNPATLAGLLQLQRERGQSDLLSANLIADGPIAQMPGGQIKLALGADFRSEDLDRGVLTPLSFDRDVSATFAEVFVPIVGPGNSRTGLQRLDISLAGRYEEYSDFGNTFNPKIGLTYSPVETIKLRSTWGTSFRAPKLIDLDEDGPRNAAFFGQVPNPNSPTGFSFIVGRSGGNRELKEETAKTWTLGLEFDLAESIDANVTYYNIEYKDRIVTPGPLNLLNILIEADQWGPILTLNPSRAEQDAICNDPRFFGPVPFCLSVPAAAIVDVRQRNLAETKVSGVDVALSNTWATTHRGNFSLGLNGTYVLKYEVAVNDAVPGIDVLDTVENPNSIRFRLTGSWAYRAFVTTLALNHVGSYDDETSARPREVADWNTVDLRMTYSPKFAPQWLHDIELALSVTNVFDEEPPFVNRATGYDSLNATPLGRFVGVQLKKAW